MKHKIWFLLISFLAVGFAVIYLTVVAIWGPRYSPKIHFWSVWICSGTIILLSVAVVKRALIGPVLNKRAPWHTFGDFLHSAEVPYKFLAVDLYSYFFRRPFEGVPLVLLLGVITVAANSLWTGTTDPEKIIAFVLGFTGLVYGILSYHVALRVDHSIRHSITDFREFLKVCADILEEEIISSRRKIKPFKPISQTDDEPPPEFSDLILLLWFPYYALTKDLNSVGPHVDELLLAIRNSVACRSYLITSADPLLLMRYFESKEYKDEAKRYDSRYSQKLWTAAPGSSGFSFTVDEHDAVDQVS